MRWNEAVSNVKKPNAKSAKKKRKEYKVLASRVTLFCVLCENLAFAVKITFETASFLFFFIAFKIQ
jgi:hypothetical protein